MIQLAHGAWTSLGWVDKAHFVGMTIAYNGMRPTVDDVIHVRLDGIKYTIAHLSRVQRRISGMQER